MKPFVYKIIKVIRNKMDTPEEIKTLKKDKKSPLVVFTFGRFQPPHIGHGLLINRVVELADELQGDHYIIVSASCTGDTWKTSRTYKTQRSNDEFKSCDKNENPLTVSEKMYFLKQMFPHAKYLNANDFKDKNGVGGNLFSVIAAFKKAGYKQVISAFGQDRAATFRKSFSRVDEKYIKEGRDPLNIPVHTCGTRDCNASDVTGTSGTNMRVAAVKKDRDTFLRFSSIPEDPRSHPENTSKMPKGPALEMMEILNGRLWPDGDIGTVPKKRKTGGAGDNKHRKPKTYRLRDDERLPSD